MKHDSLMVFAPKDLSCSPVRRGIRRRAIGLLAGATGLASLAGLGRIAPASAALAQARRLPRSRLVLAGPFAGVSNPLLRILDNAEPGLLAERLEFRSWMNPDQLRALAVSGEADFVAMPTNVAANLYNRGVKLQLVNVSSWGVLHMVSRDPALRTLADFKGKEVLMPFRNDLPDIVFRLLAAMQGIDVDSGALKLRYVATPLDAMQLLLTRRAEHALLAEPAVSVGLRKANGFPLSMVAPELHRSVDLQREWGRVLSRPARIPQAGIVVMERALDDTELIGQFQRAYTDALRWCEDEPDACGTMVAKHFDMLTPEGVADSIRVDDAQVVAAGEARAELEFFFEQILARQPGLVGGRLPSDGFYFQGKA